jgi:N-acetylmuramoyl-L-alanine amidase
VVLALAGFLLVLGGFQVYQEIQAKQRKSLETPAERIAQAYGSPDDPGLRPETADGSTGAMPVANLFGLQVRTIVIDPGHGGKDPGAIGPAGLAEKDVTLDVALRLRRRLERDYGYQILMTREDDRKITPHQRVAYANEQAADLFISIHVNALPVDTLTTVETYYFSPRGSARVERLAALENETSGYSMAEWREAIQNIETTLKFQESKQLATSIQRTHYRNMQRENGEVNDWGVRSGPFIVLLGVEVPAVLAEISVISNRAEEAKLNTAEYREQLAMSLEAGIATYLNPPSDPREPTEDASEDASEKDDD